MNWLPIVDPATFTPEDSLTPTADIIGILAHLAVSGDLHSSQGRREQQRGKAALAKLLGSIQTVDQQSPGAPAAPAKELARDRVPSAAVAGPSLPERRPLCKCGRCPWCLGNARWDRIFERKFAYPAYYDDLVLRHNSALAEVR
jgi:hypothetical protein